MNRYLCVLILLLNSLVITSFGQTITLTAPPNGNNQKSVDRRVELGQERHRQNKAANDFAMRAIAFGIAGTIITRS
jgi:hypothetical protein